MCISIAIYRTVLSSFISRCFLTGDLLQMPLTTRDYLLNLLEDGVRAGKIEGVFGVYKSIKPEMKNLQEPTDRRYYFIRESEFYQGRLKTGYPLVPSWLQKEYVMAKKHAEKTSE